jgi:hypothetical protein
LQPKEATGAFGNGFVYQLNPTLTTLLYSTYFGGSGNGNSQDLDTADGIALDSSSPPNAYITGQTYSTNIPIVTPLSGGGSLNGPSDAYVAKLPLIPTLVVTPSPFGFGPQPVGVPTNPQAFQVTNNTASGVTFSSIAVAGVSPANNTDFAILANTCSPSVAQGAPPCTVVAAESATLAITAVVTVGGQQSTDVFNVSLTGTGTPAAPVVALSAPSLTFNPQMVTTTSAAMPVTLTNMGNAALTINSIAASGDFAQTNNCPASPNTLPSTTGSNKCTINVTITPTATGARTGTLTIMDNASGSPHTVSLNGTGWDFTITATSPQSGPSSLMFNATMTPLGGFNQNVSLSCTGAPANTTCTVATPVSAQDGKTPQTAQVTVTRTGGSFMTLPPGIRIPPLSMRQFVPLILAIMLLFLLPKTRRFRVQLGLATAVVLLFFLAGCGGGGRKPITGNITITGMSTGAAGSVTHSSAPVAITLN